MVMVALSLTHINRLTLPPVRQPILVNMSLFTLTLIVGVILSLHIHRITLVGIDIGMFALAYTHHTPKSKAYGFVKDVMLLPRCLRVGTCVPYVHQLSLVVATNMY